jgi:hypothetical protein
MQAWSTAGSAVERGYASDEIPGHLEKGQSGNFEIVRRRSGKQWRF